MPAWRRSYTFSSPAHEDAHLLKPREGLKGPTGRYQSCLQELMSCILSPGCMVAWAVSLLLPSADLSSRRKNENEM